MDTAGETLRAFRDGVGAVLTFPFLATVGMVVLLVGFLVWLLGHPTALDMDAADAADLDKERERPTPPPVPSAATATTVRIRKPRAPRKVAVVVSPDAETAILPVAGGVA